MYALEVIRRYDSDGKDFASAVTAALNKLTNATLRSVQFQESTDVDGRRVFTAFILWGSLGGGGRK